MIETVQIKRLLQLLTIVLCTLFLWQMKNWEAWMRARENKDNGHHKFAGHYIWPGKGRG